MDWSDLDSKQTLKILEAYEKAWKSCWSFEPFLGNIFFFLIWVFSFWFIGLEWFSSRSKQTPEILEDYDWLRYKMDCAFEAQLMH